MAELQTEIAEERSCRLETEEKVHVHTIHMRMCVALSVCLRVCRLETARAEYAYQQGGCPHTWAWHTLGFRVNPEP